MKCPNKLCNAEMEEEFYYSLTGQTLWRCRQCGRTELIDDELEPPEWNSREAYERDTGIH